MIKVAETATEAQDIRKNGVYTNGTVVFKVAKIAPWGDNATVVTTKRGNRLILANTATVTRVIRRHLR